MTVYIPDYYFRSFLKERISNDAVEMVSKLTPVVTVDELYDELQINMEKRRILKEVYSNTGYWNNYHNIRFMLDDYTYIGGFELNIMLPKPEQMEILNVNKSRLFEPIVRLAQKWTILGYVTHEVSGFINRDALSAVFPWLRSVIMDEQYSLDDETKFNYAFFGRYSVRRKKDKDTLDTCMRIAMRQPKNIPMLPKAVKEHILIGNELFTQTRLLKDRPKREAPSNMTRVLPSFDYHYKFETVPPPIKELIEKTKNENRNIRDREKMERFEP